MVRVRVHCSSVVLTLVIGAVSLQLRSGQLLQDQNEWTRRLFVGGVIVVYLLRTALANCTTPISTAINMDFVPREHRARWSSLASMIQACWSGSAAVGGVLADRYGYAVTILITAAFHTVGTLIQATLLPLVPRRE